MAPRQSTTGGIRLRRSTILVAAAVLVLGTGGVVYLATQVNLSTLGIAAPEAPTTSAPQHVGLRMPEVISQRPRDYSQVVPAKPQAAPEPPVTAAAVAPSPAPPGMQATPPAALQQEGQRFRPPPPPGRPPGFPPAASQGPPGAPQAARPVPAQQPPGRPTGETPPAKKRKWLAESTSATVEKPPFPLEPLAAHQQAGSDLFPKAVWARPTRPERVLYWDQTVQGILLGDFNSDIPGPIRIVVTRQVEDRWGQGSVLIPQYAVLGGMPEGGLKYGGTRVPVGITAGIFPDGTAMSFEGKLADSMGATGLPGTVNNHYGKLALGVLATALLNIGARVPFGNTEGFNETLPQQFSQDFARGINQAGQNVIQRELAVNPTLTQSHGYAVSVSFSKNISFQSDPVEVSH